MRTHDRVVALVVVGLMGMASPLQALTADACKSERCERNAAINRAACSDLPANPSCLSVAEEMLRRCLASCDRFPASEGEPVTKPSKDCDSSLMECR